MNGLALFAITPRAGEFLHRFLVPSDLVVSESEISKFSKFSQAANNVSIGENFIAIGRSVPQHSGTGAVREGRELVILAGINVPQLSGEMYSRILISLQDCMGKIEKLVLYEIDWTSVSPSEVIVRRKEMQDWLDDLRSLSPPVTEWRKGPRSLLATGAVPLQPSTTPTSSMKRLKMVSLFLAFVLGIPAGALLDQLHFRSSQEAEPRESSGEIQKSTGVEPTVDITTNPPDNPISEFVGITVTDLLLREAANPDDKEFDELVALLKLLSRKGGVSVQDYKASIAFCEALLKKDHKKDRFDDCMQIVEQLIKPQEDRSLESDIVAQLKDLKQKAIEGRQSIDQQDRTRYESIRNSTGAQQLLAAQQYRDSAPRQLMSQPVKSWIEWAEKSIEAKVISIKLPTDSQYTTIWFKAKGGEIGFRVASVDDISSSRPLAIAMTLNGITVQQLPVTVEIVVETAGAYKVPLTGSGFIGNFEITTKSKGGTLVDLKSTNFLSKKGGALTVQLELEAPPELPEYSKESP